MKKSLLITLLLIPFLGLAQTNKPIEGFLGIKFESSKAEVTAAMKAKGATVLNGANDSRIQFSNVKLGPRAAEWCSVFFYNDKAYRCIFYFKPEQQPQTIEYYNALVSDVSDVYGKGSPFKSFKSPYEDGDGHEVTALEEGYATMFTKWESNNNIMQVDITTRKDDLYVLVFYIDGPLDTQKNAADKAKEKADY